MIDKDVITGGKVGMVTGIEINMVTAGKIGMVRVGKTGVEKAGKIGLVTAGKTGNVKRTVGEVSPKMWEAGFLMGWTRHHLAMPQNHCQLDTV